MAFLAPVIGAIGSAAGSAAGAIGSAAGAIGSAAGAAGGALSGAGGFIASNASAFSALAQAGGAAFSGIAALQQGRYQQKIAEQNARLATEKARDAERQAQFQRDEIRLDFARRQARGELGFAAGNVLLGTGSPLAWQTDLELAKSIDLERSRENAATQVAGFESQRRNILAEGQAAGRRGVAGAIGGAFKAGTTLLGEAKAIRKLF